MAISLAGFGSMANFSMRSGSIFWRFTLAVAIGGALGAVLREASGQLFLLASREENQFVYFTFATLTVNILGSFGLGLVVAKRGLTEERLSIEMETGFLFLSAGVFSALTSFSAFTYQIVNVWVEFQAIYSLVYIAGSIIFGLLAVGCGFWFYRWRTGSPTA